MFGMTWKVMISAPYMQPTIDRFRPFFEKNDVEIFLPPTKERLEEAELLGIISDIDGAICGDDRFTRKVLEKAGRLKVIAKWGTGTDSIDRKAASEMGIAVFNVPNAFTNPVSDTVLGYILSFARKIPWITREMQNGEWYKIPGVALHETSLGVIGVGNIGKAVIKRAIAFGMKVYGNDLIDIDKDFIQQTGICVVSKDELLENSDYISLNCDLNPTSYHLIGKREFSLMKPTAYLINTSRGPVVDENALISALQDKRIAGAAMDVFEVEPLPKGSPLRTMDNCLLAPHNANSSPEAWENVHQQTIGNLMKELKRGKALA